MKNQQKTTTQPHDHHQDDYEEKFQPQKVKLTNTKKDNHDEDRESFFTSWHKMIKRKRKSGGKEKLIKS